MIDRIRKMVLFFNLLAHSALSNWSHLGGATSLALLSQRISVVMAAQ